MRMNPHFLLTYLSLNFPRCFLRFDQAASYLGYPLFLELASEVSLERENTWLIPCLGRAQKRKDSIFYPSLSLSPTLPPDLVRVIMRRANKMKSVLS